MEAPRDVTSGVPIPQLDKNFDYYVNTKKKTPNTAKLDEKDPFWYTMGDKRDFIMPNKRRYPDGAFPEW